jgi:hypothetical protein
MTAERDFCARCAIKHLGKAKILMDEARLGYPHHVWYAMSNMSEAEDEIVSHMPFEAADIRTERLSVQEGLITSAPYTPNFTRLMYVVAKGAMLEEVQEPFDETKVDWAGCTPTGDKR